MVNEDGTVVEESAAMGRTEPVPGSPRRRLSLDLDGDEGGWMRLRGW
jgi:hypothetical protein